MVFEVTISRDGQAIRDGPSRVGLGSESPDPAFEPAPVSTHAPEYYPIFYGPSMPRTQSDEPRSQNAYSRWPDISSSDRLPVLSEQSLISNTQLRAPTLSPSDVPSTASVVCPSRSHTPCSPTFLTRRSCGQPTKRGTRDQDAFLPRGDSQPANGVIGGPSRSSIQPISATTSRIRAALTPTSQKR